MVYRIAGIGARFRNATYLSFALLHSRCYWTCLDFRYSVSQAKEYMVEFCIAFLDCVSSEVLRA